MGNNNKENSFNKYFPGSEQHMTRKQMLLVNSQENVYQMEFQKFIIRFDRNGELVL